MINKIKNTKYFCGLCCIQVNLIYLLKIQKLKKKLYIVTHICATRLLVAKCSLYIRHAVVKVLKKIKNSYIGRVEIAADFYTIRIKSMNLWIGYIK